MEVKEVVRRIEEDGWVFVRRGGRASHRIFKKDGIKEEISISGVAITITMILTVVLEQMPNNRCAHAPDLADSINATGKTREAVIKNFRDAMLDLFDFKREQGEEVPDVTALEIHETRAVETLEPLPAAA